MKRLVWAAFAGASALAASACSAAQTSPHADAGMDRARITVEVHRPSGVDPVTQTCFGCVKDTDCDLKPL
jgi:hypothetical protein